MAEEKTNVMRILEPKKGALHSTPLRPPQRRGGRGQRGRPPWTRDPASVCNDPGRPEGASRQHYVFVTPCTPLAGPESGGPGCGREVHRDDSLRPGCLPLTGYVHGGCSPVGMKKPFPTVLDGSVAGLDAIVVSAGKIGAQVELAPAALCALVGGTFAPVSK